MASMSPRWPAGKLSANASRGAPQRAIIRTAGANWRNEGIGKILLVKGRLSRFWYAVLMLLVFLVAFLAGHGFGGDDVVGLDPSGRADCETGFGARGEIARGLVVAAQEGRLRRSQVGLCVISLVAIGHRELSIAERRFGLSRHRCSQNRNRFVGIGLVIRRHERLPK